MFPLADTSIRVPKRGEIWYVDVSYQGGHAYKNRRPCLIVQRDVEDFRPATYLVAPISKASRKGRPYLQKIGLNVPSVIHYESIMPVNAEAISLFIRELSVNEKSIMAKCMIREFGLEDIAMFNLREVKFWQTTIGDDGYPLVMGELIYDNGKTKEFLVYLKEVERIAGRVFEDETDIELFLNSWKGIDFLRYLV